MSNDILDKMYACDRVLITARLEPPNGRFLQPTGFPDIGACIYRDGGGSRRCLVESEQSMANRLEAVCMKAPGVWVDDFARLPLIKVHDASGNALLATNLTEPHRIASSYVLEGKYDGGQTLKALLEQKFGLTNDGGSWPLDKRSDLEKTVFALDPGALVHGFQFIQWKFVGLRQPRLLHARLEAELAEEPELHYGMVKVDSIEPESASQKGANKGQSIAAKSRIVPKTDGIIATFEIDVLGLKCLTLTEDQKKSLLALALWKVGAFLDNRPAFDARSRQTGPALRLRTDCYLKCGKVNWTGAVGSTQGNGGEGDEEPPADPEVPPRELLAAAKEKIDQWPELEDEQLTNLFKDEQGAEPENKRPVLTVQYSRTQRQATPPTTPDQPATEGNDEGTGPDDDSDDDS